jgi:hypothetical protein
LKESGRKRLRYYKKPDKEEKTRINEMDMWLFERLVSTSAMIENTRNNHLLIEVFSQSLDSKFWKAYSLLWGKIQGVLNSLRSLQLSILLDSEKLAKFAVTESARSVQELQSMQKVIIACLVYLRKKLTRAE